MHYIYELALKRDSHHLLIVGRVPIRVKQNQAIPAHKVETTASCFGAEQEHKLFLGQVVEGHNQFLALV